GLSTSLPEEQFENVYVTRELGFEFHYFFMRKFWFAYLAKAVVVMPGGFGTLDEFFEMLTLIQTKKIEKRLPIILFGTEYWDNVINLQTMVDFGTIAQEDMDLFFVTDSVNDAFNYIVNDLTENALKEPTPNM
ncbi:MAG TPA: LOG family protein, partial [Sneathiellales bacterium]|nr:LOG family protein [Sneathiellales bacterium]